MIDKKIKIIIFVENTDYSKIWNLIINKNGYQNQILISTFSNIENTLETINLISKINENQTIYYLGLANDNSDGHLFLNTLKSNYQNISILTLSNLNVPTPFMCNNLQSNIPATTECLFYSCKSNKYLDINKFLNIYPTNHANFIFANNAFTSLIEFIENQIINVNNSSVNAIKLLESESQTKNDIIWKQNLVNPNNDNETIDFSGVLINATKDKWTKDHIYPKSKEGSNDVSNIQVCSNDTNHQKSNLERGQIKILYNGYKVTTTYELRNNFFVSTKKTGILFIKSQINTKNNIEQKDFFFYRGLVFKLDDKRNLWCYKVDFEKSKANNQIFWLENTKTLCKKSSSKKWIFPTIN